MAALAILDWVAVVWFLGCWVGYHYYSRYRAKHRHRLQNMLHAYIGDWMRVMQKRELRIVETSVIANLERTPTFLASSSLLIIAGLLTVLGSLDQAITLVDGLPLAQELTRHEWELKLLLIIFIYVYAFFTFTWCMRQYGFVSILIGAAPLHDADVSEEERERIVSTMTGVMTQAIYSFNVGLRGYYFSLAVLTWFIHPLAFALSSTWVVLVLYRREFNSRTLQALSAGR